MKNKSLLLIAVAAAFFTVRADFHHNFEKSTSGWVTYSYWGGKLALSSEAAHQGGKSMKMETTEKRNRNYALCILPLTDKYISGKQIRVAFYAKGTGRIKAGMLCYTRNSKGGEKMKFNYCEPVELNDSWQRVEFLADFSDSFVEKIAPAIELEGPGTAFVDDAEVVYLKPEGKTMKVLDRHQIVREGEALPQIRFNFTVPDETVNFFAIAENRKQQVIQTSGINDENGNIAYDGQAVMPVGSTALIAASAGVNAVHFSHVVPAAEYDELAKVASTVKLTKPLHILFIGDSLTDRDRGGNYADKLVWWLNKYNPGKVSMQNLAVSGDFITRVEGRLKVRLGQGGKAEYRQYVYKDMFNRPYDLIIIFLGHNDCASFRKSSYRTPQVPLDRALTGYRNVLAMLRSKSNAPVVLVSPVANNFEQSKKQGEISARYGGVGAVFGMPEFVVPFNTMLKKVAADNNCYFVDLYTPMKGDPALQSWFIVDGVHLTPAGNQRVSNLLLKALAAEDSPLKK